MTTTINSTKALHEAAIARLNADSFPSGTYNLDTLEVKEFAKGYQVTFCQVGDAYTDDDYDFLVAMFCEMSSDGICYAGKFGGYPEVSFHFSDLGNAVKMAKKFNQISVWDWKANGDIMTGGTGMRG